MTLAAASGDNSGSLFATPAIVADRCADGSILVKSTVALQPGARCIGDWLEHWARQAPERIFLGDRIGADDGQDGILRRADIDGAERANKILKNPDLEAPHRITGVAGQRVESDLVIQDVALRAAVSGLLAAGARLRARARFGRSGHLTVSRHRLSF